MRSSLKNWSLGLCLVVAGGGNSVLAGPRGADQAVRGTVKSGTEATRLVTGDPAQINAVIAAGPGTSMTLQPVQPKTFPASSYPAGTTIVGQTITLGSVPARIWFEIHTTGWSPECLKFVQAKIDATDNCPSCGDGGGYAGSAAFCGGFPANGGDLFPATQSCVTNTDCRSTISGLAAPCGIGEPSRCVPRPPYYPPGGNICEAGFQDKCDAQWIAAGFPNSSATNTSTLDYLYGVVVEPGDCMNEFAPSYVGTLVLDVPADAKGTYTIDFVEAESFLQNQADPPGNDIPIAAFFSGIIVTVGCGACCDETNGICTEDVTQGACEGSGGRYGGDNSDCSTMDPPCGPRADEQKLTASDAAAFDNFGVAVAVSDETIVVGSYVDDHAGGVDSGSAYVFVRGPNGVWDNGSLDQQAKLTASDAAASDGFGVSVSVSGDTAVVGAWHDAGASGAAYVFVRAGGVWTQQQKLTASDASAGDDFGVSVYVSGETVLVGAYLNNDAGADSGSAYVFTRSGTVWTQQQKLTASDAAAGDEFGYSVSVSGDTAVVGAQVNDSGSAYVFTRSGMVWTQEQRLTQSDAAADDRFGVSVSVSGDTTVVGAFRDDDAGTDSGSAYVFFCPEPTANDIVWDPATNPIPWPNNNPLATTRSLRFTVTGAGSTKLEAIKVTMVDLQHPRPANLPAQPPPNYTTYDTRLNGVCVGGSLAGHHCDTTADCASPGTCTGGLAACTADPACADPLKCTLPSNSCARWVGKLGTFYESQGPPVSGPYKAARLQCTPYYWDWKPEGLLTVVGADIAPSSVYSVEVYGASCLGVEATCTEKSVPVTMYTRRSGDVEAPFNPPSATGQPDVTDVSQLVNKFKNLPGAPVKAISQIQPNLPELNANINVLDILAVVDALKGVKYAFSGPCACPSLVTCELTACTSDTPCINAYGAGSKCVKMCTGPGSLAGDLCIDNTHCVGSGTCGTGFCRDRCVRCKP